MMASMIAGSLCAFGLLTAFAASASAAEVGLVIALPDAPFVIPQMLTNVTTQLYNNARQGANLTETVLNPVSVRRRFGKLHQQQVKGQILAQPLYVHDVDVDGLGRRSLIIVATAANIVYALDANDLSIVFPPIELSPNIIVDPESKTNNSKVGVCGETYPPYIGVTSTPVIDLATGVVFVESFNPETAQQELHALSLHDRFASHKKVVIAPPKGESSDWPMRHRNRAGLLLSRDVVYVAFSSFICDHPGPFAGWVLGYNAQDLTQVARWETPNSRDSVHVNGSSGIWQSGRGLVAADDGTIYFMTGNDGNLDLADHLHDNDDFRDFRLANSFVKLRPSGPPDGLILVNSFSPKNSSQLSVGDTDLGSSGPLLLPGDRLIGGGKQGRVYVIDTSTMRSLQDHTQPGDDGFQGFQAFHNNYHPLSGPKSCTAAFDNGNPDKYCRDLHLDVSQKCPYVQPTDSCSLPISCYQYCQAYGPNIHAGFVYWQDAAGSGIIYAMPEKENVKAFRYNLLEKTVEETPIAKSDFMVPDGMPGGALSISANGTQDGIVWVSMPNQSDAMVGIHRGSLVALDAKDLHTLWMDPCIFYFAKFNPPIVADGRVYLATFADPVADPSLAKKPGELTPDGRCDGPDPSIVGRPDPATSDPEVFRRQLNFYLNLPVGFAWVIEYGLQ
jgi:hypothetical protein